MCISHDKQSMHDVIVQMIMFGVTSSPPLTTETRSGQVSSSSSSRHSDQPFIRRLARAADALCCL